MAKFEINRHCPSCGCAAARVIGYLNAMHVGISNDTYQNFLEILRVAPEDEFPIVEGTCGFVFAGWLPNQEFLRALYEDVIDHSRTVTETIAYRQSLLEFGAAFLHLVQLKAQSTSLRLLDFGCGYGALLRMLSSRDIDAYGFEPSETRNLTAERVQQRKILTTLDEIQDHAPYDLFVCTEVLEHIHDPRAALRLFKASATPRALAAITVPNCHNNYVLESLAAAKAGKSISPVFNPWEHLNYFSPESLRKMLHEEGWIIIHDFGRSQPALDACFRFGEVPPSNFVLNNMRIAKRSLATRPTTQIVCQLV